MINLCQNLDSRDSTMIEIKREALSNNEMMLANNLNSKMTNLNEQNIIQSNAHICYKNVGTSHPVFTQNENEAIKTIQNGTKPNVSLLFFYLFFLFLYIYCF